MARPLIPLDFPQPGYLGLNKQGGDGVLDPRYAAEAVNLVYNEFGRLASRKGTDYRIAGYLSSTTDVFEYIDASGNTLIIYSNADELLKEDTGSTTDIKGTTTPREWKFVNFNGWCCGHHPDYAPIELTTVGGTFALAGGTQYNGTDVLASNGRLWILDGNTLRYSDLLINNFTGGSSGSFDLAMYWPDGMDEAVALAEWNDLLIVFGKHSIIIYENPDDPTSSMAISDTISGVGCISRDSVQPVGTDLLFMSGTGLKTIGRTIQEKSAPLREISKNVADYIIDLAQTEIGYGSAGRIRSVYSETHRFYAISFLLGSVVLVFDMTKQMEDGSFRATEWDILVGGWEQLADGTLIIMESGGAVSASVPCDYTGWTDGYTSASYQITYETPWNDFGEEVSRNIKALKSLNVLLESADSEDLTLKWATDYSATFVSQTITLPATGVAVKKIKQPLSREGQVAKVRLEADVDGTEKIIKRLNVMAKIGRYS